MKSIILSLIISISAFAMPPWFNDENKAGAHAFKTHTPIVVFVYSDHCGWCQKMIAGYQSGPLHEAFMKSKVTFLRIPDGDPRIQKYGFTHERLPATFFIDAYGNKIGPKIDGFIPPSEMADTIMKFSDWYQSLNKRTNKPSQKQPQK